FHIITGPVEEQLTEFYDQRVKKVARELEVNDEQMAKLNMPKAVPILMKREDAEEWGLKVPAGAAFEDAQGAQWCRPPFWVEPLRWEIAVSAAQRQVGRRP